MLWQSNTPFLGGLYPGVATTKTTDFSVGFLGGFYPEMMASGNWFCSSILMGFDLGHGYQLAFNGGMF